MLGATFVTIAVAAVMIRGNHVSSRELMSAVMSSKNFMPTQSTSRGQARSITVTLPVAQNGLDRRGIPIEHDVKSRGTAVRGNGLDAGRKEQLAKWKICEILKVCCWKHHHLPRGFFWRILGHHQFPAIHSGGHCHQCRMGKVHPRTAPGFRCCVSLMMLF